ncbi:MAG: DJ-1 family protein [Parcubacteria group bacterium CG_4_10_14_0_2_um_filter_7_35_8]|nr:MAG: DJ-1 family protein [Parcubacteria group bacterium CG_4_10_14_0_2_um_filter_7_35_8]
MKKIAFIIAFKDFNDEEYLIPKQILESAGFEIITVSNNLGEAIGSEGAEAIVNVLIKDLKVKNFIAIVFIGGSGALKYFDDSNVHHIALEAISEKKLLAAICIAPIILAKAGILNGKNATVWSSNLDKSFINILKKEGANYIAKPIVIDNNIITASGPESAKAFAIKILDRL